jgi:hypothetical protein
MDLLDFNMGFIEFLFGEKVQKVQEVNHQDDIEQQVILKVIETLRSEPEDYSAMWSSKKTLDRSVRNQKRNIVVMISTGDILSPIDVDVSPSQKKIILELIHPILERDKKIILKQLLGT